LFINNENVITISDISLCINDSIFKFSDSNVIDYSFNNLMNLKKDALIPFYLDLKFFLINSSINGELVNVNKSINEIESVRSSILSEHLRNTLKKINTINEFDFKYHCVSLIGVGEGLTPTGDDFLCGMLASTYFLRTKKH
jgi:hypothetical protein